MCRDQTRDTQGPALAPRAGTYALGLVAVTVTCLQIGRLGTLYVRPGFYVYLGSAFGPGGVRGRLAHHQRLAARPHWHIDYLRPYVQLAHIWYSYALQRYEHQWAQAVNGAPGVTIPLAGFGASDCTCASHLFFFLKQPHALAQWLSGTCQENDAILYSRGDALRPGRGNRNQLRQG